MTVNGKIDELNLRNITEIIEFNNLLKVVDSKHFQNNRKFEYWFKIEFVKPVLKPDFSQEIPKIIKLGFYISAFKHFDTDPENIIDIWFTKF